MKLKHFTKWSEEKIKPNELYETSWLESNYWIQKKENRELGTEMSEVLNRLDLFLKNLGKIVDLSFFSNEMQQSKYYAELLKEYIFEEVRLNEFPDKPSRINCMFMAPIEVDINDYCDNINFKISDLTILEVNISDDSNFHFADMTLLNCNSLTHNEKVEKAREYWNGTGNRDLNTEILFRGSFKMKVKD